MQYDLILKPNRTSMMRYVIVFVILIILAVVAYTISNIYWDEYVSFYTNWRGRRRATGWPKTLRLAADWMAMIGGVGGLAILVVIFRKKSSFGLNKDGLMINLMGWNETFIEWKDISGIRDEKGGSEAVIEFYNLTDVIERLGGKQKDHLIRAYVDKKRPIKIAPSTAKGDINGFIAKLKQYYPTTKL